VTTTGRGQYSRHNAIPANFEEPNNRLSELEGAARARRKSDRCSTRPVPPGAAAACSLTAEEHQGAPAVGAARAVTV
jgi:hypothetical protein